MISEQALKEFQNVWKQEFGEKISDEGAMEEALNLLTMFDAIYRPTKKAWNDDYEINQRNTEY